MKTRFKVYVAGGLIASCKHADDAAMLAGAYGDGATIHDGMLRIVVWREGKEEISAAESYDTVARTCWERIRAHHDRTIAFYSKDPSA